nr:MAG TPA: hypothetical protein [Caudoviricetes sp.]
MIYIIDEKEANKIISLKAIKTIINLELFDIIEKDLKKNSKEELLYNLSYIYDDTIKYLFTKRGLEPTSGDICIILDRAEQFIREY